MRGWKAGRRGNPRSSGWQCHAHSSRKADVARDSKSHFNLATGAVWGSRSEIKVTQLRHSPRTY